MIHDLVPIEERRDPDGERGERQYRGTCSCGAIGEWRPSKDEVRTDHGWHELAASNRDAEQNEVRP